jgi:hypothetical protein
MLFTTCSIRRRLREKRAARIRTTAGGPAPSGLPAPFLPGSPVLPGPWFFQTGVRSGEQRITGCDRDAHPLQFGRDVAGDQVPANALATGCDPETIRLCVDGREDAAIADDVGGATKFVERVVCDDRSEAIRAAA